MWNKAPSTRKPRGKRAFDLTKFDLTTPTNPSGSFCEAEGRADPMSVQSSTRPKAEEVLLSGATFTFTHLVNGQLLGLRSGLRLGLWLGLGLWSQLWLRLSL